jgi:hypothetical protein
LKYRQISIHPHPQDFDGFNPPAQWTTQPVRQIASGQSWIVQI